MSWRSLGRLWETLVDIRVPLGVQGGPWEVQGRVFIDFGVSFWSLGASLFDKSRAVEPNFSMHAFRMVSVRVLCWFVVVQGGPRTRQIIEIRSTIVKKQGLTKKHEK